MNFGGVSFWAITRPKSAKSKYAEDIPPPYFLKIYLHTKSQQLWPSNEVGNKKKLLKKTSVTFGNGQKTGFTGPAPIFNSTPAFVRKNCTKNHKTYPHQKLLLRELWVIFCKFGHFPLSSVCSPVYY